MNNKYDIAALERIFHYHEQRLRTVIRDGQIWFVVIDVCGALEIGNTRDAISRLISDDVGLIELVDSRGRRQRMRIINEAGLYTLMLSSRKPEARAFGHWVTHEVLPTLRRSGVYRLPGALEFERLKQEIAVMLPKAEFYDAVADSSDSFSMGETAKMIGRSGYGRNNLIRFLREQGILMTGNVPKQRYMDCGYFRVIQSEYAEAGGAMRLKTVTRVREKGVDFIRRQLHS